MNSRARIWFIVGAASALLAYSAHPLLWKNAFYHLVAFAFTGYLRALYLQSKGRESLWVFIVWLWSCNALLDELFFDPRAFELNEYIGAVLIAVISYVKRKKWIR